MHGSTCAPGVHGRHHGPSPGAPSHPLLVSVSPDPGAGPLARWDEFVLGTDGSDVAQLSGWARVRRHAGYRPLYLLAQRGPAVVGGTLVLRRRIRGLGVIGYLPYGPLVAGHETSGEVASRLGAELAAVAWSHRALFVQPPEGGAGIVAELLGQGFRASTAGIAPAASIQVDLERSEDELRAGLSRRLRTWTRRWPERGVRVRVGDASDLPLLARLATQTGIHQGFEPHTPEYLSALYAELAPLGQAVLLVGEIDGQPVASELLTGSGGVLKSRITGLDREHPETVRQNVASAVIWDGMRWARHAGYRRFDLGGVRAETAAALRDPATSVPVEDLPAPDQFKLKFGGRLVEYPQAVETIRPAAVRAAYDLARRRKVGLRLLTAARDRLRHLGP